MKKLFKTSLLAVGVMLGVLLIPQTANAAPTQIPSGEYSVHIPAQLGWGHAVAYALATDTKNIGWGYWDVYTDGKKDYVISIPMTTKSLAFDLLRNVCKKNPKSGAIRLNQVTGKEVQTCAAFAPKTSTGGSSSSGGGSYSNSQSGVASFYEYSERGTLAFSGRYRNSNGCAHKTLPPGTNVKIVASNGNTTFCKVDDRGPYIGGRIIDLLPHQFSDLTSLSRGTISVTIYY